MVRESGLESENSRLGLVFNLEKTLGEPIAFSENGGNSALSPGLL